MKYYMMKNTDLEVSALALGTMRIPDKGIDAAEKLIHTALDLGINFIDEADIYGGGTSEEMLGDIFDRNPGLRDKVILQSKAGIVFRNGHRYDMSKSYIVPAVEDSLRRLRTDHLDILLLHRPDALMDPAEVAEAFDELHKAGKVRYFGVSNQNASQMRLLSKYMHMPIVADQLQFSLLHSGLVDQGIFVNMIDSEATDRDGGTLNYCMLEDIRIQSWSPLQASGWTGTFIDNPKYAKTNEILADLADKYGVSKTAVALAWILRHPAGMQPILGTTSVEHLTESCDATNFTLTNQEWYDLYLAEGKPLP